MQINEEKLKELLYKVLGNNEKYNFWSLEIGDSRKVLEMSYFNQDFLQ